MVSCKTYSFRYKDTFQLSQLTIGIFCVWFSLLVGLQEVSSTIGDHCNTPSDCSTPAEDCVTSTNKCGCSADYYQTSSSGCQMRPAKPGALTDVQLISEELGTYTYDIAFVGSQGQVSYYYRMKINNETRLATGSSTTVTFRSLQPGQNYSYSITAYNGNDVPSEPSTGTLDTPVIAARDVTDVSASSTRNSTTGLVSLRVTWTPGDFTGPTNYLVTLKEETNLFSNSFSSLSVETVTGYNNNEWTKANVLAYWNYRVFVLAMTDAGNSSLVGPSNLRTATNIPGLPQDVIVQQNDTVAQELALTITCPPEKERNGTITGYVIRKTLLSSIGVIQESEYRVSADSSQTCTDTYTAKDVGGIIVEHNYTFAVKVRNTDFNGRFSSDFYLYVEPKAPRFEEILKDHGVSSLVRRHEGSTKHQTAIDVSVCASCLLDGRQGTVKKVGLVVCKVGSDDQCMDKIRKRRSLSIFEDFTTWSRARSKSFTVPYRATPDKWMSSLTSPNTSYPYRIGTDANCQTSANSGYCNGPLPSYARFRVAVIQCNSVGCVIGTFEGPFSTGIDESDDTTLAIALAVVIPVVIIIAIIIVIVIVIKHRRRQQNKSEEDQRPYNTMNTAMNDAHLYHGVTGRAYVSPTHTNHGGSDNIAMVGLQTPQASLHQRDDTEYTEPDHYDYIYDNDHHSSENQPSQRHGRVRQTGGEVQNPINPYSNVSASMNAQKKKDYYNM